VFYVGNLGNQGLRIVVSVGAFALGEKLREHNLFLGIEMEVQKHLQRNCYEKGV
jgi:hypothetical protein